MIDKKKYNLYSTRKNMMARYFPNYKYYGAKGANQ